MDTAYRERAKECSLRTTAPRRYNPSREAWLPILHLDQDGWSFTAQYSNTARAHELGRHKDWVVIYFAIDDEREHMRTVVTETRGPLEGKRAIRGREAECRKFYFGCLTSALLHLAESFHARRIAAATNVASEPIVDQLRPRH